MQSEKGDPRLLQRFVRSGPALDRDLAIPDKNDAEPSDEKIWLEVARKQNDAISEAEVEFFAELRRRSKGS